MASLFPSPEKANRSYGEYSTKIDSKVIVDLGQYLRHVEKNRMYIRLCNGYYINYEIKYYERIENKMVGKEKKIVIKTYWFIAFVYFLFLIVFLPVGLFLLFVCITRTNGSSDLIAAVIATFTGSVCLLRIIGLVRYNRKEGIIDEKGIIFFSFCSSEQQSWSNVKHIDFLARGNGRKLVFTFNNGTKHTFDLTNVSLNMSSEEVYDIVLEYYSIFG